MRFVTLLALVLSCAGCWAPSGPLTKPRNVLLITIDTLRTDRVGCYGPDRGLTPNLDRLAADGTRFSHAFTPVPLTAPSHATMLTGRYPLTHGLQNNGTEVLSPDEVLLPEILHENGFQTAAIVSALVLSSSFGLNQGFDLYYEDGIKSTPGKGSRLWSDQRRGDKTVDRALTWLKAEGERPFFLWVHLFDPHAPYDPPSPYSEKYAKSPYDGEVAFADAQVGRLLDEVRRMGLYDDTLIIASGDHGEGLGDHGEQFHGIFLYNSTTHIPLIVRAPGGRRGVVCGDLASTLDITPSVLDALKIPPKQPLQGVSLVEALRGGRISARSLYLETIYPSASYGWSDERALLQPTWKLIDLPHPELYDLKGDADERYDQYGSQPARVAEMRPELNQLAAELSASAREVETAAIDDETLDRLRSLGYIGGQRTRAREGQGADPKDMVGLVGPLALSMELVKQKRFSDAAELSRRALERDPDDKIALLNLAEALTLQGRLDDALPYFERAMRIYPDGEEFYRVYGWALIRASRLDAAQQVFKRALVQLPRSGHMHFMLGYSRFLKKDCKGATPELDLATRMNPRFGKAYYLLAICRLEAGDESGALASMEDYLKRDADVESLFDDPYFASMRQRRAFQELIKRYL